MRQMLGKDGPDRLTYPTIFQNESFRLILPPVKAKRSHPPHVLADGDSWFGDGSLSNG